MLFATRPVPEPAFRAFLYHNNPRVVYRTPAVGAVVWFRQDRWWRCL